MHDTKGLSTTNKAKKSAKKHKIRAESNEPAYSDQMRNSLGMITKPSKQMKLNCAISTGDTIFRQANSTTSGGGGKSNQTLSTAYSVRTTSSAA